MSVMRRVLRICIVAGGAALVVVALTVAGVWFGSERVLAAPAAAATSVFDPAGGSIEHGAHLAESSLGCEACHGADLAGAPVATDGAFATLWAPNLTRGAGGVGTAYSDADFERAIRHGVRPGGGAFVVMPSSSFAALSDQDARDVIAFVRSVPPVDRATPPRELGPLARLLLVTGRLRPESVPVASDFAPLATTPDGVTVDRGHYLAIVSGCERCHGTDFGGGTSGDPKAPPAPDLTAGAAAWPADQFVATLRDGQDPSGHFLDKSMPSTSIGKMTDDELNALDLYLKSLPRAHS